MCPKPLYITFVDAFSINSKLKFRENGGISANQAVLEPKHLIGPKNYQQRVLNFIRCRYFKY